MYTGEGDIFDFQGVKSFEQEHQTGKDYGLEFVNTSKQDKVIAFAPALMLGLPMKTIDAKVAGIDAYITKDGGIESRDGDVTGLPDPDGGSTGALTSQSLNAASPIEYMLNYVANSPHRVVRMNLQSNEKQQFATVIEQHIISPFKRSNGNMTINLRDHVSSDQFQEDRVEIPLLSNARVLTLASDSVIVLKLKANSSLQVNWDMGAGFQASHILRKRAAYAHSLINAKHNGPLQSK